MAKKINPSGRLGNGASLKKLQNNPLRREDQPHEMKENIMGDRAQIAIKQHDGSKIYLYSHWDGTGLLDILKEALSSPAGKSRWDDHCYLARIIFCRMVKDNVGGETGYGIDNAIHADVHYPIPVLDCDEKMITWEGDHSEEKSPISFADFIKA